MTSFLMILALALPTASNAYLMRERDCKRVADLSVDIFNQVKQAPNVSLNGMLAGDEAAFTFIRQWVKEGKSRDELYQFTYDSCMGESI
jgi:hypothetical protein